MKLREAALNLVTGGQYTRFLRDAQEQRDDLAALAYLRESSTFLYERAKEDLAWQNMAKDATRYLTVDREDKIEWARRAYETDAFAKRAVQLKTDFCFGSGIDGPRAKTAPGENDDPNFAVLSDFWNDPGNQAALFSAPMQAMRSNQLQVDGGLFLLLFVRPGGAVSVRPFGATIVKKIVVDPEDATRPLYYACRVSDYQFDATAGGLKSVDGQSRWVYYRDFRNTDPLRDPLEGQVPVDPDVYMMHVPINCIRDGAFGESELLTSLKWLNAAKMIADDQATISKATAALMNRLTVNTKSASALSNLRQSLQSTTDSGGPKTPLAGSMNIMSDGVTLETSRSSTNAPDAWQNSRMMRLPAAVGVGMPLHYLGDPENANLATARVMDTPALKTLEAYQSLWRSIYVDLFTFALQARGLDADAVRYDIPLPVFVEADLAGTAAAIMDALDRGLVTFLQAAQRIMELLGLDDIPERLKELMEDAAARERAEASDLEQALNTQDTDAAQTEGRDADT